MEDFNTAQLVPVPRTAGPEPAQFRNRLHNRQGQPIQAASSDQCRKAGRPQDPDRKNHLLARLFHRVHQDQALNPREGRELHLALRHVPEEDQGRAHQGGQEALRHHPKPLP